MPMTFNDNDVHVFLEMTGCSTDGVPEEKRERAAQKSESLDDPLQAWEIRNNKGWNEMTALDAMSLIQRFPKMVNNPGVLSRINT